MVILRRHAGIGRTEGGTFFTGAYGALVILTLSTEGAGLWFVCFWEKGTA